MIWQLLCEVSLFSFHNAFALHAFHFGEFKFIYFWILRPIFSMEGDKIKQNLGRLNRRYIETFRHNYQNLSNYPKN